MHKMVTVGTDEGAGRGRSNLKTLVREERAGGFTQKNAKVLGGLTPVFKEVVQNWEKEDPVRVREDVPVSLWRISLLKEIRVKDL